MTGTAERKRQKSAAEIRYCLVSAAFPGQNRCFVTAKTTAVLTLSIFASDKGERQKWAKTRYIF
jgi:hypothetical protein